MEDTGKSNVEYLRHAGPVGLAEGEKADENIARELDSSTSTPFRI